MGESLYHNYWACILTCSRVNVVLWNEDWAVDLRFRVIHPKKGAPRSISEADTGLGISRFIRPSWLVSWCLQGMMEMKLNRNVPTVSLVDIDPTKPVYSQAVMLKPEIKELGFFVVRNLWLGLGYDCRFLLWVMSQSAACGNLGLH